MHLYFYVEAYDANKFQLVRVFSGYEIEFYNGTTWQAPPRLVATNKIAQCDTPREGEDCFYSKYNVRFVGKFNDAKLMHCEAERILGVIEVLKANQVTCELTASYCTN